MIKPMLRAVVTYFIFRAEIPAFLHMCAGRCRKMKTVRFFKKQDQLISSISNSSNVGLTHTHTCEKERERESQRERERGREREWVGEPEVQHV